MSPAASHIPLPPKEMRFMKEDDERLVRQGVELANLLYTHGLDRTNGRLLDAGCGYGRLAIGLLSTDFKGSYLGFDILKKQIGWCAETLTSAFPAYQFRHLNVRNDRYNPNGDIDAKAVRFPAKSATRDACALFSVFTHMYEPDVRHYLDEIRRVLRPGGIAVTTWLVFDEARLSAATSDRAAYPLVHVLEPRIRYSDPSDPLRAIGFEESFVREMVQEAGLDVQTIARGTWTGEPGADFQDLVIIRKPAIKPSFVQRIKNVFVRR